MAEPNTPTEAAKQEDDGRRHARESERLEALRERLYARGNEQEAAFARHGYSDITPKTESPQQSVPPLSPVAPISAQASVTTPMTRTSSRSKFRTILMVLGIVFFVVALGVSAAFLFMGNNTISGSNIAIDVEGPISVGGGEVMNLQVAIANQNTLPIESATMVITYPRGAQSVTEVGKELFTERLQLNNIGPNEVVNVPVRVMMFGEENDVKNIAIAVEYRVQGSNATFYKEALPFEFKISTSPVVINVDSVKSIPSGQEATIEVSVESNASEELTNLLLKVNYPRGFEFKDSDVDTVSGEDTWKIAQLKPGEKKKISITGTVTGNEGDVNDFDFSIGVANERDALSIASTLATREAAITIERPFLDVAVTVNGEPDETVVVDMTSQVSVAVSFRNALNTSIYDGTIKVKLEGNALNELRVTPSDGYYDSSQNLITWDSVDIPALRELAPGDDYKVSFIIDPRKDTRQNPEIRLVVTIGGNRLGEDRVSEQVIDTIARTIKVAGSAKLTSSALYTEGPFTNSGPVPPIAERTTEYTFLFAAKNGSNPVSDALMTAIVPQYVTWLDRVSPEGSVMYNAANRTLTWDVGDLKSNEYKEVWVQVALKPSLSQVGITPTLLETQRFRATDRFTSTAVRTEAPALTTSLKNDPNQSLREGTVGR